MATKTFIPLLLIIAAIISSCGTNKKLAAKQAEVDELQSKYNDLNSQVSQLTTTNNNLNKQVSDLTTQNKAVNDQFTQYKKQCQENEEELRDVNAAFEELRGNFAKLEEKLETALADFKEKGLDVYSKEGVIYVDMKDNLLYKTGSAALTAEGKKALGNLASVLNEYPKLEVIVVGNTDTSSIKGVADNWSLSTERANGVVRNLVKENSVDPSRLVAAGKGKFSPIASNSTADGRAQNRRTEIVLNPDWDRLWQSVKKE